MHYNQGPYTRRHAGVTRTYDDWSNTFVGLVTDTGSAGELKLGLYDPYGKAVGRPASAAFRHPHAIELFNLTADPHETTNVYVPLSAAHGTPHPHPMGPMAPHTRAPEETATLTAHT